MRRLPRSREERADNIVSRLIPLASVLSPSSLTSEVRELFNSTTCPNVATLNFTREGKNNFRKEDSYAGASLIFLNTTDVKGEQPGFFDYYDQPSKNGKRLAVTSIYLSKPATNPNASLNACGERWNCTYTMNFEAPGYKCDDVASSSNPDVGTAPFNLSVLAPQGDAIYYASTDLNDYMDPQIETGDNGVPIPKPPYPDSLGVFQSEPVLWIGHSVKTNKLYDDDSPYKRQRLVDAHLLLSCSSQLLGVCSHFLDSPAWIGFFSAKKLRGSMS